MRGEVETHYVVPHQTPEKILICPIQYMKKWNTCLIYIREPKVMRKLISNLNESVNTQVNRREKLTGFAKPNSSNTPCL
ncbi:hypothetical protein C922_05189 [Plasmodium inui San Antonio 1]|uniref:Uncharacterized protein n=1 Tax=Plasmodium inui San Antonio 1 TaxID=1237626 RepID=W6ZYT2_9APIC|nr:hypothetical protein C922_05189 [Plasmodium inui San Antonio 1]EUD64445.1 hypothetical protein C922_05189 [Plasmodium inui San Antonio 1]